MVNDENFVKTKKSVGKHDKKNEEFKEKNKKDEKVQKNKLKIPKDISQEILKKMFINLIKAVIITVYFIVLNIAYSSMKQDRLTNDIEVFATVFLVLGIFYIEKAYKKDENSYAQSGIEFLVLSLHSLSIMHVITQFKCDFRLYLLTSSYIISIYYVFIYKREKRLFT